MPPPPFPGWRVSRHRHRFASGPRRGGSSSSSGSGECQARNHYKRKRRREEEEETLFTFAKPSSRPSHKRRTPADAPPPAPGPRRIVGPASARAAPRDRPAPAPTPKPAGCRAGGGPAPIRRCAPEPGRVARGWGDLGQVTAGGRAAAWAALGAGWGAHRPPGVEFETPALRGAEMAQGHSISGRAPTGIRVSRLSGQQVPASGCATPSPVRWE